MSAACRILEVAKQDDVPAPAWAAGFTCIHTTGDSLNMADEAPKLIGFGPDEQLCDERCVRCGGTYRG